MKRSINIIIVAVIVALAGPLNGEEGPKAENLQTYSLDASSALVLRLRVTPLPSPAVAPPPPGSLPPGVHWGGPVKLVVKTYEVVLIKDNAESVIDTFSFKEMAEAHWGTFNGKFGNFGIFQQQDTGHYTYVYNRKTYIAKLRKIDGVFQKVHQCALNRSYDNSMGSPKLLESPAHDVILQYDRYKNPFIENAAGNFIEETQ